MTVPAECKMMLERAAMELQVSIVGVHSACLIDGDTVDAIFDVEPDDSASGLHFRCPLPESVARNDLKLFVLWLVAPPDPAELTLH